MSSNKDSLDISVIIPFKDRSKMTLACLLSFIKIGPDVREILLISNSSSSTELETIKKGVNGLDNVRVLEYNEPFNYQKMNNWAVKQSSGKFIFFLNNDTEFVRASKGVVEKMLGLASKNKVGMVGCMLLYGDGRTIQHAGVYLRPGSLGDHIYVGKYYDKAIKNVSSPEFPYDVRIDRPVTAVTGAAQIIGRAKFDKVKGFDENFIIGGGDVDLCIRLGKAGFQTWIMGSGHILHKESQSRAFKPIPYQDFYYSYLSYITVFDLKRGDPFSPKITENIR
jgi:GT2 family glycosyltransferase